MKTDRSTLVVLRTHDPDPATHQRHRDLAFRCGYDFVVTVDCGADAAKKVQCAVVRADRESIRAAGFPIVKGDEPWRCGDYAYYLVRKAFPGYSFYWMVEPDVFMSFAPAHPLLLLYDGISADFIAPGLQRAHIDWFWTHAGRCWFPEVWSCHFPFTRISGRAIDYLCQMRGEIAEMLRREIDSADSRLELEPSREVWPNDECFVASALHCGQFACVDLNRPVGKVYEKESFCFNNYFLAEELERLPPSSLVYHSVLTRRQIVDKLCRKPSLISRLHRPVISRIMASASVAELADPAFTDALSLVAGRLFTRNSGPDV